MAPMPWTVHPPSYHDPVPPQVPNGDLYDVINDGFGGDVQLTR